MKEKSDREVLTIRKAEQNDANQIALILEKSFPYNDNQRNLGFSVITAFFKMLIKTQGQIVLVCDTENGTMGYIWLEAWRFSFKNAIFSVPIETLSVIKEIIKDGRPLNLLKHARGGSSIKVGYPKIVSLSVDESARHLGIGTNLIIRAQEFLKENNMFQYYVLVSTDNEGALTFFEQNGFIPENSKEGSVLLKKSIRIKK